MSKRVWSILSALGVAACALSACQSAAPSVSAPEQTTAVTTAATTVTTAVTDVTTVAPTDLPVSSSTAAPTTSKRPTTTTTATTTAATTTTNPLPPSTPYGKDIIVDMDGYTFVYTSPWLKSVSPLLDNDEFLTLQELQLLERAEQVMDKYNCKIFFKQFYVSEANLRIYKQAGKAPADVCEASVREMHLAAAAGCLESFTALTEITRTINTRDARWLQPYFDVGRSRFNGQIYGVRGVEYSVLPAVRNCVAFNKDLVRAAGKDPDALYDAVVDGEWNFDMLREISLAVSQKEGAWGVTGKYTHLVEGFVWGNGGRFIEFEKYTPVSGLGSDKVQTALAYLDRLVNGDKVVFLPEESYDEANWEKFYDGSERFLAGEVAFLFCDSWMLYQQLRPNARFSYGMLPLPKGPDADGYVNPVHHGMVLTIPTGHKNVKKAGIVLNALMRPVEQGATERTVREEWFQRRDAHSMISYTMCVQNPLADVGYGVPALVDGLYHVAADRILRQQTAPTPLPDFSEQINAAYGAR